QPDVPGLRGRAPDRDPPLPGVAVVRVEREREGVADELADGPRLGDVAGEVHVARRLVGVEAYLHLRGAELEPLLDHAADLVHAALAVAADRCVEGELAPPRAAQELPDRLAEDLAPEIPQRPVQCGRAGAACRPRG